MIDSLRSRFRDRFISTAEGRLRTGLACVGPEGDAETARSELHSLAGEASMLGFTEIADAARKGEAAARKWEIEGDVAAKAEVARALRALGRMLTALKSESEASGSAAGAGERAGMRKGRILIVDDSEISSEQVAEALSDAGYEVETAVDMALALASMAKSTPRVVLADVNIPGVECDELCRRLKEEASSTPVILVSAMSEAELQERARQAGADGFISKTSGLEGIIEGVRGLLEEAGG